jgi:hypothetical protein
VFLARPSLEPLARGLLGEAAVHSITGSLVVTILTATAQAAAPAAEAPARADGTAVAPAGEAPLTTAQTAGDVNGLYPLWEQTAVLHPRGGGQIGYGHAQLGLGRVQIGTQPFLDLYGTLNLELKIALWAEGRHRLAVTANGYRLPTAAHEKSIGDLYPSGFTNPYGPLELVPLSLAHTFAVTPRVRLHSAFTALIQLGEDTGDDHLSVGKTAMLEWALSPRWSTRVHAGLWGLGAQAKAHLGLSFGYTGAHLAASAGYARQLNFTGESRSVLLVDGALLFR